MAKIKAAASGNWSATSTWTGGVVPGPGDDVYSNNFTVTIDQNITVNSLNAVADTGIGAIAGGSFVISASSISVTITQGIQTGNISGNLGLIQISSSNTTITITATNNGFTGGSSSQNYAIRHNGTAALVLNGNVNGGPGTSAYGLSVNGACAVTINGNVNGANGNVSYGVNAAISGSSVLVTGNVTAAGSAGSGVSVGGAGRLTVQGNLTAASGVPAVASSGGVTRVGNPNQIVVLTSSQGAYAVERGLQIVPNTKVIQMLASDVSFPAFGSELIPLETQGITVGDGVVLLSDIAKVVGAQIAAAVSS